MTRGSVELAALVWAAMTSVTAGTAAQPQPIPPVPPAPEVAPAPSPEPNLEVEVERRRVGRSIVRIGQGFTLRKGEVASELLVILGDAVIEGEVDRDVTVILGNAQLSPTALVGDSVVVTGGNVIASAGSRVDRDLVIVGGRLDAPAGFAPAGEHVVIGFGSLGGRFETMTPWVTRGLLWGRPIVPELPWVWIVVGIFFFVYLLLNLIFDEPVRLCATTLADKPFTAFVAGLLVLLLIGPVCLLLAVSVIGLAVVPFVLAALVLAWIIGKVAVARGIGMRVARQESPESRPQAVRSFVIGFAIICLAYMIPVLGFVAWSMIGVLGLGAAMLAFMGAYRHESPPPMPAVPTRVAPPPAPNQEGAALPHLDASAAGLAPSAASGSPAMASDLASFPRAAFGDRLAAFVLDVILVVIADQLLDLTRRDGTVFLLLLGYHIGFWTWKGTTVGGIICQLRVVRVDGSPLRFVDAFVRGLSSIFSFAVLGIGCLWILRDPDRQAWHDKIAGTYVVKVPRNWPL